MIAVLSLSFSPAMAQEYVVSLLPPVAANPGVLTLAELEGLALSKNPTIPAAAALVTQQQGLLRQATLYPNPTAGYLRTDADQPGQTLQNGAFFSQEFVTAGKIRLAREAGRYDVEHSEWQLRAQNARVVNDVRIRFYELLGAQEAIAATDELEKLASNGVAIAKRLLDARLGLKPDVLQAEIQLSVVKTLVEDARLREKTARKQLAHVVGISELPNEPAAGQLEDAIPALDFEQQLGKALTSSPLLQAQDALIQSVQWELKLARAQAIPNVNVQVVAQRDSVQKYSTVSTLVSLPLPVFNRNQGNIQNMEGQLRQQQNERVRLELAIRDQLATAFRHYQSLRSHADRLGRDILPRAKENLDLTTKAYEVGQFDFPRVLAARQTYFQTKLAHIDALTELHKIAVEIDGMLLTGGLNPTEVGTALQGQAGAGSTGIRGILFQQLQEQRNGASRNLPGAVQAGER
jgi:cobalt-zinc-cadmium efflux system outer membrane protein